MGIFLDKPNREKETESGEGNGLHYAHSSMQGWRVEMEDAHTIRSGLGTGMQNSSFFAVFDGHAGDFVSKYSSEHLIKTILELWHSQEGNHQKGLNNKDGIDEMERSIFSDSETLEQFKHTIREGFLKMDSDMRKLPKFETGEEKSGTTAVTAFVTPSKIIFANCGDSRALLCNNKIVKFATSDHKPYNEEEKRRIENAGGSVMIQRVNGNLAVSRALGDYDYKSTPDLPPIEQLVSAEPEIDIIDRSDSDEFLILACDGIWDVMSNQDVVDYIYSRLQVHSDYSKITDELLETCLAKVRL